MSSTSHTNDPEFEAAEEFQDAVMEQEQPVTVKNALSSIAQPVQAQPVQAQPVQAQPVQAQLVQTQPVQAQPVQAQPPQAQLVQAQPVQAQPPRVQIAQGQPTQALFTQVRPAQREPTRAEPSQAQPSQNEPAHAETVQDNTMPDENSSDSEDQELTIRQRLRRLLILFRIAYPMHPLSSILTTIFSVFAFLVFYPVLDTFEVLLCLSDWPSRGMKRRAEIVMNIFIFVFLIYGAFNLVIPSGPSTFLIDMMDPQQDVLLVTPQKETEAVKVLSNKLARGSEDRRMEQVWDTLRDIESKTEGVMGFYDKEAAKRNNEMLQFQQQFDKVEDQYKRYFHEQKTPGQSTTPSSNELLLEKALKGIDDGKLHQATSKDLSDNDIKLPDYALASRGARIIYPLTSPSFMTNKMRFDSLRHFLGFDVKNSNLEHAALEPTTSVGHCWKMLGNAGRIAMVLTGRIKVNAITLEFPTQFFVQDFSTAHKDFQLFGVKNIYDNIADFVPLGQTFRYDAEKAGVQTFTVENEEDFRMVMIKFSGNWGSIERTDVYRVRVHGNIF